MKVSYYFKVWPAVPVIRGYTSTIQINSSFFETFHVTAACQLSAKTPRGGSWNTLPHRILSTFLVNCPPLAACQAGASWTCSFLFEAMLLYKLPFFCLFVVYLKTLFQYLRLYSVDFYSILIRLPYNSEAGETRVRNMAAEFCRRAPIVLVGFFNMP
jgi:hypothetical protein